MKGKPLVWLAVFAVLAWAGGAAPESGLASAGKPHAPPCGGPDSSRALVEPPDVEVWKLPTNSAGEHELILAVHADKMRFCYKYAWNGEMQTVAPTIRVRRGEHFAVRIVNDIATPSRAAHLPSAAIPACHPMDMPPMKPVHYVGYLNHTIDDRLMHVPPVDTNLHLHGFEGPADEENVFLSTLSTPVHACEYRITIPATQPPGTYIYHPHAHGASDIQVAAGLAGAWIVEPDQPQLPRSAEHVIVVRYRLPIAFDNLFAPNGEDDAFVAAAMAHEVALPIASPVPYDPFNPPPWPVTYPMKEAGVASDPTGCNATDPDAQLAIDGSRTPVTIEVPAGQTQLLRIVDATSDSAAPLQMRDASGRVVPLHVAALDGIPVSGDMERPLAHYLPMNEVMLTTMARADVLVAAEAGSTLTLSKEHYCEGKDAFYQLRHDLVRIVGVSGSAPQGPALDSTPVNPADTPAARLAAYARAHPSLVRRRAWTFTEYAFPKNGKLKAHQSYFLTETSNKNFHEHSYWPVFRAGTTVPANPDIVVKRGAVEEWYLINATMESHEFHMHQMAFVTENGPGGVPTMGDTAFVSIGSLLPNPQDPNYPLIKPGITKILLDFRNVPRGTFVFHCHMLFHEDRGMMASIRVK
jgi:FtsP/CotA-like multicopper oxidase with cupredoxin domain